MTAVQHAALGEGIVRQINELAAISEEDGKLTRIYLTKELRTASDLILGWMREAGMSAHLELADADAGARVLLRVIETFRPRER